MSIHQHEPDIGDSVAQWVKQLERGDESAAEHLWSRFFLRLTAVARRRMHSGAGHLKDDEDIALSAFNSLCVGIRNGRFRELNDRNSLWRLLLTIAARKINDHLVFNQRQKRDVTRQQTIYASDSELLQELICEEPRPEVAAELTEQVERLLAALEHEDLRSIALWKMEGFTNEEIAVRLNRSLATVERKLRTIRSIWGQAT